MKVAYVTNYNSEDIHYWSGTGYHIAESLQRQGLELVRVNCFLKFSIIQRLKRKLVKVFTNRKLLLERETAYLKKIAAKAKQELSKLDFDIIVSPGSLPVTYLRSDKPIVIFTDATYDCFISLYAKGQHLSRRSIIQGNAAEATALQNASLVFYPSSWAIESAIKTYRTDPQKIVQIGFGANISSTKTAAEIRQQIALRKKKKDKNFLFIGVDWYRKGAQKAIETVAVLNERGVKASITLVGCKVPDGEHLPDFVTCYPFISKSDKAGQAALQELFEKADFFILPTIADCTPIVFSEAASYGLPVITTDVGGCLSVILDNKTGFCIKRENFVEEAAEKIMELCLCEEKYESFCLQAYFHFQNELNWDVIGQKAVAVMERLVGLKDN